jgi:hypothetical protein
MFHYSPIAYEDYSKLNAQWDQARPAVAGLGGQHEYRDVSYLNARLRPIMPAQVGMGGLGTLSGNALHVGGGGLGQDELSMPWGDYSADTKAFQEELNIQLHAMFEDLGQEVNLVCPGGLLDPDGKLGPRTCGLAMAVSEYFSGAMGVPETCESYSWDCGAPYKPPGPTPGPVPKTPSFGSKAGDTNWMLIGGGIAAVAVGAALIFRASKG